MEQQESKKLINDLGKFVIGLFMAIAGIYLFMNQVQVTTTNFWGWRYSLFGGWFTITSFGITLIPFIIGVSLIFFNVRSKTGWAVMVISLIAIFIGIIASLRVVFMPAPLYVILGILALLAGGLGLMARALLPERKTTVYRELPSSLDSLPPSETQPTRLNGSQWAIVGLLFVVLALVWTLLIILTQMFWL